MSLKPTRDQTKIFIWAVLSIASLGVIAIAGTIQAMILAVGQYSDADAIFGLSPPNFHYTLTHALGNFLGGMVALLYAFLMIFRKKPYRATLLAIAVVIMLVLIQWLFWTTIASV
jgi:hypothetical protein